MAKPSYTSPTWNTGWAHYADRVFGFPLMEGSGTPADLESGTVVFNTPWTWITSTETSETAVEPSGTSDGEFSVATALPSSSGSIIIMADHGGSGTGPAGSANFFWSDTNEDWLLRRASTNNSFELGNSAETTTGSVFNANLAIYFFLWDGTGREIRTSDWNGSSFDTTTQFYTSATAPGANSPASKTFIGTNGSAAQTDNEGEFLAVICISDRMTATECNTFASSPWAWVQEGSGSSVAPLAGNHLNRLNNN